MLSRLFHGVTAALAVSATLWGSAALAAGPPGAGAPTQSTFRLVSEDLASAVAYKPLTSSDSTGIVGFDVGMAVLVNQIRNRDAFALVLPPPPGGGAGPPAGGGAGAPPAALLQYALRVNKGLPMDVDIGASVSKFVGVGFQVVGANVRWAAFSEGTYMPAVSLRAAASQLLGIDQLALRTVSYDVALSKRLSFITAYAGVGQVQTLATAVGGGLQAEDFKLLRVFGGAGLTLYKVQMLLEVDKTGEAANLGMKLGLEF